MKDIDIASLVKRCLAKDEDAWNILVGIYTRIVFRLCREKSLSQVEAEDILGKVGAKVLKKLKDIKSKKSFLGYVKEVARNQIWHFHRDSKTHEKLEEAVKDTINPNRHRDPLEDLIYEEEKIIMLMALEELPLRCRKLFELDFFQEERLSQEEIANSLGIPKSSIGPTQQRCRRKLEKILQKYGIDEEY